MNFFKNLSISGKIISILLLVIALEVVLSVVGMYYVNSLNTSLNYVVDTEAEKVRLGARINRNLVEIHRTQKNMLLSDKKEDVDLYSTSISGYKTELEQRLSDLRALAKKERLGLLDKFEVDYREFLRIHDEVASLVFKQWERSEGESRVASGLVRAEAIALSKGRGRNAYDRAAASIEAIVDRNDEDLDRTKVSSDREANMAWGMMIALSIVLIAVGLIVGLLVARSIAAGLRDMVAVANAIAEGNMETPVEIRGRDEIGRLATSIAQMQTALRKAGDETAAQDWLKTGVARLNDVMRGELDVANLSTQVISEITTYLDAKVGALYLLNSREEAPMLSLMGSYAYTKRKNLSNQFRLGEGLVGQAALEKQQILVRNVPEEYIRVTSGLGEATPQFISVTPFLYEGRIKGVIEIGSLGEITDVQLGYLGQAMSSVAISFETAQGRAELAKALAQSQSLTEELQRQQEELRAANEELEEQTQLLQQSEEKLKVQQEELEVSNEELEERNEALERQKREVGQARLEIEEKAEELAIASKYKSEFLANMSHELRTPLNSLLLLSRLLADNKEGNLTEEQVESAGIIYASGNDLLSLINEVLDLSKIEAGRMDLQVEPVSIQDLADGIRSSFQHMADEKGLRLEVSIGATCPAEIVADRKRVEQITRNLMSNAIKFTEKGGITVRFARPAGDVNLSRSGLDPAKAMAVAIEDTGIGIPPEQQKVIFEAFQQVQGGTARKYGGTGLGLSISKELARLLGGEIQLSSEVGKGSVFTLYLPVKAAEKGRKKDTPEPPSTGWKAKADGGIPDVRPQAPVVEHIPDDRDHLEEDNKVILVIEDDSNFAKLLVNQCHQKGFKGLASATGEGGLELAETYLPAAIILDIRLPGIDGWTVLEALKDNPKTRHIPVHIMSVEEGTMDAFRKGAIGYLTKPAKKEELEEAFRKLEDMFSRQMKDLLVVEDDEDLRKSMIKLVGDGDVHADEAASGEETIRALQSRKYDCMILDLGLPDMTGFQLLKTLEALEDVMIPPIIVYTGRELTREEERELRDYAESIIIKGVRSEERLLDEVSLFLHRAVDRMPEKKRQMITNLHDTDAMFRDKRILMVDDDMRNVFALSRVLEEKGIDVLKAEDGKKALDILEKEPGIDLVLMDIMMPVMDGYETMQRIRAQEKFQRLPIIALTAKAMKEDRERCMAAGASDYLSKPVDVNRLSSLMRVWLYR